MVSCKVTGCDYREVARSVGLDPKEFLPPRVNGGDTGTDKPKVTARYRYRDRQGKLLFEVWRYEPGFEGRKKDFIPYRLVQGEWRKGLPREIPRVLYRLPELLLADLGEPVFVCAGEKDADNVAALGLVATTNPFGEEIRWERNPQFIEPLKGRRCIILEDFDAVNPRRGVRPGEEHAKQVFAALTNAGVEAKRLLLPGLVEGEDASDWIKKGGTAEQLRELCRPPPHPIISKLLNREQLRNLPPPLWQIDGILQEQSIVEIYGESNHGKSLVGVDLGLSVVRAGSWASRPILKPGPVIYVNADGGPGFSDRLRWWEKANGTESVWEFWTYPEEIILHDREEMRQFTEGLALLEEAPVMIFFDTLSQCIPGANENAQDEMSLVIRHLNAIKRRYGSTVVLLHHVGKDGLNRGSTVIPGAADTIARASQLPGNIIELRCDKQRGGRKFEPLYFQMETLGTDEGVYLTEADSPGQEALKVAREQQVLDVLRGNGGPLTREEVRRRMLGLSSASVYRYLKSLVKQGMVIEIDEKTEEGRPAKAYLAKAVEEQGEFH